jgi:DNA-directed RNA polymerase subunit beta'
VPRSVHVNVQEGERFRAGDRLIAIPAAASRGPIDPHDVLAVLGIKELQRYLVDKIQEVYRSQSVAINDKYIEVICRQMLRSVRVTRVGDTDFLVDEQVDRFRFMEENEKVMNRSGERQTERRCCSASPKRRCRPIRSSQQDRSRRPRES